MSKCHIMVFSFGRAASHGQLERLVKKPGRGEKGFEL